MPAHTESVYDYPLPQTSLRLGKTDLEGNQSEERKERDTQHCLFLQQILTLKAVDEVQACSLTAYCLQKWQGIDRLLQSDWLA